MPDSERDSVLGSDSGASGSSPVRPSERMTSPPAPEPHSVPLQKVKAIMGTHSDLLPCTPDGLYAMAKGAELFVEHLLGLTAARHGSDVVEYDHLAETIQSDGDLEFLHDFFPKRITFEEARQLAEERAASEDD